MVIVIDIRNAVVIGVLRIGRVVVVMVATMIRIIVVTQAIPVSVRLHQRITSVDYQRTVEHPVIVEVVTGRGIAAQIQRDLPEIDALTIAKHQASANPV